AWVRDKKARFVVSLSLAQLINTLAQLDQHSANASLKRRSAVGVAVEDQKPDRQKFGHVAKRGGLVPGILANTVVSSAHFPRKASLHGLLPSGPTMTRFLISLVALSIASPAVAAEPPWKAGFAKSNITPEKFLWMSGYASRTSPADEKETDLWAKAMVLESPDQRKLVLVTLDLVGIDSDLSRRVCKLIQEKYKLPREAIVLSVSHTHCGPVVGSTLRPMYFLDDEQSKLVNEYTEKLPGLIVKAVDAAMANLEPVKLTASVGKATFAVNRRENKEADIPMLREKGLLKGPVDHDVPVLAAHDAKGKLKGIVFGYACHATVMSYQKWSGDYPGFAMIDLEAAHPGTIAMFWAGCGADQNPLPRRAVTLAKGYGKQLADAVEAVLVKSMRQIEPEFAAVYREIDLPLAEIPSREEFVKDSMSQNKYVAARAKWLLKKIKAGETIQGTYSYPVQTWRLGKELTLVTLGGEVVVDYSLRLKKELGPNLWVMAYANDVMAYIPSLRVLKEGGYEGGGAMVYYGLPAVWGTKVEETIVVEVCKQVKKVRGK
ncbi:MAG TPA: neutral/alkaline non-lysosomal ceramidase N-terminal domain-containing protein, partial [Gemmata sp.]|nr:neutral/alkaline non-lysosomal ceramidase N-terminal domain-containing protein [Gemmata sp.]